MSECVVRMEMPKNCFECPFSIIDETGVWCNCITNNVYGYVERDEDCPIICSLPEGHGRLVDAEILRAKLIEHIAETNCFYHAFNETPTIVPAAAERSET